MAQDFFKSPMKFPPQIDPATGRFEVSDEEINLEELMEEKVVLKDLEERQCSDFVSSLGNDSLFKCYKLDSRNEEEIQIQIKNLAAGYVPEWNFDISNPDIGSALALVFARQMQQNVNKLNQNVEKYHHELVNLLDMDPVPAKASQAVVVMDVREDVELEKGTKFLAEKEQQTFETVAEAYLTSAKLKSVFMTSKESGKILPVMGAFDKKSYIGEKYNYFAEGRKNELSPFSLFQFQDKGLEKHGLVFFHNCIFDVEEETIDCKIEGAPELIREIEAGRFKFLYYTQEGFFPIEHYRVMDQHILLEKERLGQPVQIEDTFYHVIVLEANEVPDKSMFMDSITFSAIGELKNIEYAGNQEIDYMAEQFPIFGDRLENGAECYIGLERYFSKKGSKIFLKFHTSFDERTYGLHRKKESGNLKLIKRKIKTTEQVQVPGVCADEISIEYYNGMGWKRLECDVEYANLFAGTKEADMELSFYCPKDWEKEQIGSYHGRLLRIRLLNARNSEMGAAVHYVPIISNMRVAYSYEENRQIPQMAKVFSGTQVKDITKELQSARKMEAFGKGNYEENSLYLGFDKKLISGPVSLWWQLSGNGKNDRLEFAYSTKNGLKNMQVRDFTRNLTETGLMIFDFGQDMDFMELEGENCCWIRIENTGEVKSNIKIQQIIPNAIIVSNSDKSGRKGNVEAGSIRSICNKELGITNIYNPLAAFGGCEAESRERMIQRGAYLFSSGNRLVTEKDYQREALFFSDNIDKVSVINGWGKDNVYRERMLSIVPLMKDFEKGKESFYQLQDRLKQHLLQHCELSISEEELQIEDPVFVKLNVEVWIDIVKQEDHFKVKTLVQEILEKFLNPVSNDINKGWDFGVIPQKSQIMIRLNSLKNRACIRHLMVTAQYEDSDGIHEIDLEDIKPSPYMVVMNGSHRVHVTNHEEKEK